MTFRNLTQEELIKYVRLSINPYFKDWVLFENGTYIILEDLKDGKFIEEIAMEQMAQFGPVHAGGPAGDFNVLKLDDTEGWVVSGHGYGMYTYVHPIELNSQNPKDYEIGLYGRGKRDMDGQNPKVICINKR
ncbi:MAG: hypothetical protein GY810_26050 [Aureispira sp.]|nr:hypothetical protein [Aureispira sp.]